MQSFSPDNWATRLFWLRRPTHYVAVIWTFLFGSACHLWLADAAAPEWATANGIYIVGLLLLVLRSYLLGWVACAIGVAIPIFFLRDQLTQSTVLLFSAAVGVVTELRCLRDREQTERYCDIALKTIGIIGALTYLLAAIHKLNADFLDPATSCAVYGFDKVERYYNLPTTIVSGVWDVWLPHFALVIETSIPFFYAIKQRRLAWITAVIFHIPLTVTMAPAFAFVMAIGHVAMAHPDDLTWARKTIQARWPIIVAVGTALTAFSLGVHVFYATTVNVWPEWSMIPKEWLLWTALVGLLIAPSHSALRRDVGYYRVAIVLFIVNGLTPYLGVQYQHAAAMLSNLRIDEGCWNSLVFPESVRVTEDYVRIDVVHFREPGANPKYENIVLTQLWSPPQIRQMRRNWCRPNSQPLYLSGTFRNQRWSIDDLCADDLAWPFSQDGVFGVEVFGDFLRFQKNLERDCPQACIH